MATPLADISYKTTRINYSSGWNDINLIAFMGILLIFVCNKYHRTLNNDELSH
jgi:hypothetical protein